MIQRNHAILKSLCWFSSTTQAVIRRYLVSAGTAVLACQMAAFGQSPAVGQLVPETLPAVVAITPDAENQVDTLSLADVESIAVANNPTLLQAHAQIRAAQGGAYQAGLYLNPEIGYTSDQIGILGTAGELQGGYISQEFVTGGKLRLSRAKWNQRAKIARTNSTAQRERVLNDIRRLYFRTIAARQILAVQQDKFAVAKDDLLTHQEMLNLGQTNQPGLLNAEIAMHRSQLRLRSVENQCDEAWRNLVTMAGVPGLHSSTLAGSLEPEGATLDWESALNLVLENSPELMAAREKVCHDAIAVQRERVEPIPNITISTSVGRNYETDETVAAVTAGFPLPVFDRNRGTVRQASADLRRSKANVTRMEMELTTRLAAEFRRYETAWQQVQVFQAALLPKSKQAYELLHRSYKARRAPWSDVLAAHRTYLDLQSEHIQLALSYRVSDIAIRGMLLSGGLSEPAAPISGGHIDAVPKPR